jgi:hypothetical protein
MESGNHLNGASPKSLKSREIKNKKLTKVYEGMDVKQQKK